MALAHVYVADGFEEVELMTIVDVLRRAGIDALMVALSENTVARGAHRAAVQMNMPFSVATDLADVIVLPGGGPGTQNLLASAPLQERLRAHLAGGKRVAAICAAPMVLARAGILKDKRACCYPGCENALIEGGATISAYNVVTDGLVTTSRGPGTAAAFGFELARLLVGAEKADEVRWEMLYS